MLLDTAPLPRASLRILKLKLDQLHAVCTQQNRQSAATQLRISQFLVISGEQIVL